MKVFYSAILLHIFFMRDHFPRIYTLRSYNSYRALRANGDIFENIESVFCRL